MGCDIHGVWQAKVDGQWKDVASTWDQDRHYLLFSWLADVRNGFGFAGIKTYDPVKPIADPRGLPADFVVDGEDHPTVLEAIDPRRVKYREAGEPVQTWMGDHSHSWLTGEEILSSKRPGLTHKTGVIDLAAFRKWKGGSPGEWCGGISGPGLVTSTPDTIDKNTTHVRIEWDEPDDGLDYFVDEVKRLADLHGAANLRLVFGFDS